MSEGHESCSCGCCGEQKHHHEHVETICSCHSEQYESCGHHHGHHDCHDHHEDACSCHGHHHDHHENCSCSHDHDEDGCGCGCGCGHEHGKEDGKEELLLCTGAAVLLLTGLLGKWGIISTALMLLAYLLVGFDILKTAFSNICRGRIFDENFLMTIAGIGAICIGETAEAVLVMLLYRVGEYLQGRAVAKSRSSIRALMDIRPDCANLLEGEEIREVEAGSVNVGQLILIRPGERVPLDGIVVEGSSQLDTAALTGESLPRECGAGDEVLAGCINLSGLLKVRVSKSFGESAASRILELVEHASRNKAVSEKFISRFARIYTPIVCALAVVIAVVPGLAGWNNWANAVYNALCFLVISCPCALVISVPLSFFAGIGCASRNGILVKGGNFLDALARAEIAALDKTGTLTKGVFSVAEVHAARGVSDDTLLRCAALAECQSNHPIAKAILTSCVVDAGEVNEYHEHSGHGVSAKCADGMLYAGKPDYLRSLGITVPVVDSIGTLVSVALDGTYLGTLVLRDILKDDAADAIRELKKLGIAKTVMLSGDSGTVVEQVAKELHLSAAYSQLLPEDKLCHMEALREQLSDRGTLLYAGDGINDTPVLTAADVGIAMGGLGTDAAIEAADAVIMGDEPGKIALAVRIARKTCRIANENIVFSIAVKIAIMVLSAFGHVELWLAVFADVGVCMITILNALRVNRI